MNAPGSVLSGPALEGRWTGLMDITVAERKFSLRSKYDISAPDCQYYAEGSRWPFSSRFKLLSADREQELARIIWRFSFFRDRYDIRLRSSGTVYRFWCENLWRVVYACKGEQAFYRLYQHKGLTYSLFRGERQVAAIEKTRFVIGNGDRYDIRVNRSENTLLVICMALVLDALDGSYDSTVTVDLGNIGPEARRFDESWEPD